MTVKQVEFRSMRCNSWCFLLILPLLVWSVSPACAQDKIDPNSPAAKYSVILKDFEKALPDYTKRLQGAATVAEQGKIFREENPQPAIALRLLELAKAHPKDLVAYDSLTWIVQNSEFGPAAEKPYTEAIQLLASRYVDHKDTEKLLERMATSPFDSSAQFLKAVFEKHPNAVVRGRAGFHWALHLKNYCATVDQLRSQPGWAKNIELFVGSETFNRLKNANTIKLLSQADDLLVRIQNDYALIAYKKINLGKAAEAELFEMRNLAIGKTAPELEGDDTEGKKLKLSDYRGKVVVLVFWGTWCPHCMAMVPTERALVKRYEGQPFAMLGVNSDLDRERLKPALVKHGITWRSFYDGPTSDGPIATKWNVQGWPVVYVLDGKGLIRYRNVRGEQLDRAVGELMKEVK